MKEIVPYSYAEQKVVNKLVVDIADDIPDEHEEDAEFVTARTVEYGSGGEYTGWMWKEKMHGRGTLRYVWGGQSRYDGLWKNGGREGVGRDMCSEYALQGVWMNNTRSEGMMKHHMDGDVEKLVDGEWMSTN